MARVMSGLLATALSSLAVPASAASIVQAGIDEGVGFAYFDTSLGTLNSVTLSLGQLSLPRDWVVVAPGSGGERTVSYNLSETFTLSLFNPFGSTQYSEGVATSVTTGAQTQTVTLTPAPEGSPFFKGPASAGIFTATFTGSAEFDISNLALFTAGSSDDNLDRVYYDLYWNGFHLGGPDSADIFGPIQVNGGPSQLVLNAGCGEGNSDTFAEYCGTTGMTLTYNYTPFSGAGAVPEPGTWTMMLVGFGAIGFSMRRHRRTALQAS